MKKRKYPNRIDTLAELVGCVECKQSIVCPGSNCLRGPIPAAFMVNLPGKILHKLMLDGMWIYSRRD